MFELRVALALSAVLFFSACSSDNENHASSDTTNGACPTDWQSALDAHEYAGFSGTLVYVEQGSVVCSFASGQADRSTNRPITTETVFSIGSITKTFTAAAVLKLIDEERFTLDDSAGSLLPGLSGPAAAASIAQLLSHTSGLQGVHSADFVPMDAAEAITAISALGSAFESGTDYLYSNSGYSVLALIVNELTGSYRQYIANEILTLPDGERLGGFWSGTPSAEGPRAFGYSADGTLSEQLGNFAGPHWAFDGNGGLAMTSEQLATWTQALTNGEIISPDAVDTMSTIIWDFGDGSGEAPGWLVTGQPIYEQTVLEANGASSIVKHEMSLAWQPETGRILVVATNANEGRFIAEEETADVFTSGGAINGPTLLSAEDAAFIESVSGRYTTGSEYFTVARLDDDLVIAANGTDTIAALFPPGELRADFDEHTARVTAFFNGETAAGRAEIQLLTNNNAGISPVVTSLGTFIDVEGIATAVEIIFGPDDKALGIYRLRPNGSLISAWIQRWPGQLEFIPHVPLKRAGNQWVPAVVDWPIASIAVSFSDDGSMTVTGPNSAIQAFPE